MKKEDLIKSLYTSRSGVKWDNSQVKTWEEALNWLKHREGPTVTVTTKVSQCLF